MTAHEEQKKIEQAKAQEALTEVPTKKAEKSE